MFTSSAIVDGLRVFLTVVAKTFSQSLRGVVVHVHAFADLFVFIF